ncbi:MAG: D-glycero-beta-D-manno-heptose 1-phosphate adenylyltransferase [Bacteroidetes bacterium]|nr:D-glycero-beta-D-manno-heptose 1-phosphate adenylyltransferase [Bacteroidota bacterium]
MNFLDKARQKILTPENLKQTLAYWNFKDFRLVFTNGCFDILHRGHIDYLSKARALGDILIIGLNTDNSVGRLKGPNRPVNNQEARALLLASLSFVDAIIYFDDDTPHSLIQHIQPDVLVKGSDYEPENIVGADIVKAKGGRIETIEFLKGFSTSGIIEKLKK